MSYHPNYCAILYSLSCLLDALDGYAARKFNQATKFGAVLDMVTDRCTTACLLVFLSAAYTNYAVLFQVLISLDLASHYMHMYVASFFLVHVLLLACYLRPVLEGKGRNDSAILGTSTLRALPWELGVANGDFRRIGMPRWIPEPFPTRKLRRSAARF